MELLLRVGCLPQHISSHANAAPTVHALCEVRLLDNLLVLPSLLRPSRLLFLVGRLGSVVGQDFELRHRLGF